MRRSSSWLAIVSLWIVALLVAPLSGCSSNPIEGTGQLQVALLGTSASGTIYRLREAIITVQGPASTTFFNTEEDPNRTSLTATVVAGGYSVFLQEGWHLERLGADGTPVRVQATFLSPNPQAFTVAANGHTVVTMHFRAGPDDVNMDQGSFDIVLQVDEPTVPVVNCTSAAECGAGQTCCMAGFLGTCQTLAAGQTCALPDLTVSQQTAAASIVFSHETFEPTSCAIAESCVGGPGDRRLLRFSTQTPNVGAADMILGDPTGNPSFEFSQCHGHYHFEGYARYQLLDAAGNVAATGHKQAFCLLDSERIAGDAEPTQRYHCGFQGIQHGWSDIYGSGLDCQWVDITGVPAGDYRLLVTINPDHVLPESNYDNNTAEVPVHIGEDLPADPLAACANVEQSDNRDCGWQIPEGFQNVACTPGQAVNVGCGCATPTCVGDPVLRICDGGSACTHNNDLLSVDDTCGFCPQASFTCPASGTYTVMTAAYRSDTAATCQPQVSTTPAP